MLDNIANLGFYVAVFIVFISIIVFIHEYGHYIVAKLCGVKVETFSIGFGKEIFGINDKSGTRWKFSMIPLGGYVKMFGDLGPASSEDTELLTKMTEDEKKVAFHYKSLWQKALIVAAGPAANFLLAIAIYFAVFTTYGKITIPPEIGGIEENGVAQAANFQSGDIITKINGIPTHDFSDLVMIISSHPNMKVDIEFNRNGEELETTIIPTQINTTNIFGEKVKIGRVGITSTDKRTSERLDPLDALTQATHKTRAIASLSLQSLWQMITGKRSTDQLRGILTVGKYTGKAAKMGLQTLLMIMAAVSISLGLINLFPIPMLDGGHLLFYGIEATTRKKVSEKVKDFAFRLGFVIIMMLMIYALYNDVRFF